MGSLDGKVAIVTGAGRGLGRAEALLLAKQGAKVVVNDPGTSLSGQGGDDAPAALVVKEIEALGGEAVASQADCADWSAGKGLIDTAIEAFGRLDIVVNSAGILRDGMSFNMSEDDWSSVLRVHLTGSFVPARFASAHWRDCAKRGEQVAGRIINTSSEAGLLGTTGQVNYASAKAAVAAMTVTLARELARYGVTVNAISPRAITRLSAEVNQVPQDQVGQEDPTDWMSPHNVAPLVAYLASDAAAHVSGQVFLLIGNRLELWNGWAPAAHVETDAPWTVHSIEAAAAQIFAAGHSAGPQPLPWEQEPA